MRLSRLPSGLAAIGLAALSFVPSARAQVAPGADGPLELLLQALGVSDLTLVAIELPDGLPRAFSAPIDLDGTPAGLILEKRSLRAPGFRLIEDGPRGPVAVDPPPVATYRGRVVIPGQKDGRVAASLLQDGLYATIALEDGATYGIQPVQPYVPGLPAAVHALYRARDIVPDGGTCGVQAGPAPLGSAPGGPLLATGNSITEIAFDADFEFFQKNGSSVTQTASDIEAVLNAVEAIYENDVQVAYLFTALVVRTVEPDPYTTTVPSGLLNEFRTFWNNFHGDLHRDVAHLMTGKNLDGSVIGIASLGVVCKKNAAYGLSQSKFTSNFTSRVGLTAHELGHNFNSPHCSGSGCFIMCPSLGGCGPVTQFGAFAQGAITTYVSQNSCFGDDLAPLPIPFFEPFAGPSLDPTAWPTVAGATASSAAVQEPSAPYSLNLDSTDEARTAPIALGAEPGASVSYHTEHRGVENGESLVVEFLDDQLAWVELNRITSDGQDQSAFEFHSHALGQSALHDQFQLRFRAEGNAGNDDWYVDDLLIGPPPVVPPAIFSVVPPTTEALKGDLLTVNGEGFNGDNLQVTVAGVPLLPLWDVTLVDEGTMEIKPPTLSMLGQADLVVSTTKGTSAPTPITYVVTDPPRLLGPPLAFNFQFIEWTWGGAPGQLSFLLANLDGATVPFQGASMLSPVLFLPLAPTDQAGIGSLTAQLLGVPAGAQLNLQILLIPPPGTNPAQAELTNIAVTFVPI